MKFNIELDLDQIEIWHDETTLEQEVVKSIKEAVIKEIQRNLKAQTHEEIEIRCKRYIDDKFSHMVNAYFNDYIKNEKIQWRDTGDKPKEQTFSQWIRDYLAEKMKGYFYGGFDKTMNDVAKKFAEDLKKAYDLKFAALIVKNMAEQKLLKDEELAKLIPHD